VPLVDAKLWSAYNILEFHFLHIRGILCEIRIEAIMKISNIFNKIWHDPVISKLIAGILLVVISPIITVFVLGAKDKLFHPIPIIISIIGLIIFLIIFLLLILLIRKKYLNINDEYNKLSDNMMKLRTKLNANNFDDLYKEIEMLLNENDKLKNITNEIGNIPYSDRYELFNIGDIVKVRTEGAADPKKFTVIRKACNFIFAVDKDNIEQKFSPEALSTASE